MLIIAMLITVGKPQGQQFSDTGIKSIVLHVYNWIISIAYCALVELIYLKVLNLWLGIIGLIVCSLA